MVFDAAKHHRRSIRLPGYDYSQPGLYFVTICVEGRVCLFGDVVDGKVILGPAGYCVQAVWLDLPNRFATLQLDAFVAMPNHIHGVIALMKPVLPGKEAPQHQGGTSPAPTAGLPTLGAVVGAFKSISAIAVNRTNHRIGRSLWQRNYYEHIIRSGEDLDEIQRYIAQNPLKWGEDPLNPASLAQQGHLD